MKLFRTIGFTLLLTFSSQLRLVARPQAAIDGTSANWKTAKSPQEARLIEDQRYNDVIAGLDKMHRNIYADYSTDRIACGNDYRTNASCLKAAAEKRDRRLAQNDQLRAKANAFHANQIEDIYRYWGDIFNSRGGGNPGGTQAGGDAGTTPDGGANPTGIRGRANPSGNPGGGNPLPAGAVPSGDREAPDAGVSGFLGSFPGSKNACGSFCYSYLWEKGIFNVNPGPTKTPGDIGHLNPVPGDVAVVYQRFTGTEFYQPLHFAIYQGNGIFFQRNGASSVEVVTAEFFRNFSNAIVRYVTPEKL